MAYLDLNSPYVPAILAMSSDGPDNPLAGIDKFILRATTDGNAVVIFQGFSPQRPKDGTFMTRIYFRGNYIAYPRRVFACDDGEQFDAKKVAVRPFAPSDSWMKEHNIRCILTFTAVPGQDLRWTVRRI